MYNPDKYVNKSLRARPSQGRGKERVRVILSAALQVFKERGIEKTTTNDIVRRAGMPIGSLYRYYPNKDSIVSALTELYVSDLSRIFAKVGKHPMLEHLSWEEVLLLLVDGWVQFVRLNGSFALLYAIKANRRLYDQNRASWQLLVKSFSKVIKKRCPSATEKDVILCFQFCLTAAEMGINSDEYPMMGTHPHYEAVGVIAAHMLRVCGTPGHHTDTILR